MFESYSDCVETASVRYSAASVWPRLREDLRGDVLKLQAKGNYYRLRVGRFRVLFLLAGDAIKVYAVGRHWPSQFLMRSQGPRGPTAIACPVHDPQSIAGHARGWSRTRPQTLIAGCWATLAFITPRIIFLFMATIAEVEKLALDLPESQRAVLAAHLLGSLPSVLHDEDEGIAEALRRDAELDANPLAGISLEQLDQQIERRRS